MITNFKTEIPVLANQEFLSSKIEIFLDVVVTLGIMLDWLPGYLGVKNPIFASGTKLIVVPIILIDLVRSNQKYVLNLFAWIYTLAFLVGVGGGWFLGNISHAEMISLIPTILVLMFYLKSRTPQNHIKILQTMFYASLLVPISIVLSWLGFLTPRDLVETEEFTRVLGAVTWSSLGLFTSIAPATFGGVLLNLNSRIKRGFLTWIIAVISLSAGFWGVMLSAQRSAGLAFFLAIGLAGILLFFRVPARQKVILLIYFILIVIVFSFVFPLLAQGVAGAFITRMSQLQNLGDGRRMFALNHLLYDFSMNPSLIGPGNSVSYSNLGISNMHIIFGQAYYAGGLVFMIMLLFSFVGAGYKLIIRLFNQKYRSVFYPSIALLTMLISSGIQLLTHPGLYVRLVYLMLGLSLANVVLEKSVEINPS